MPDFENAHRRQAGVRFFNELVHRVGMFESYPLGENSSPDEAPLSEQSTPIDYGRIERPLRLVTVSDRGMMPLLHRGQQVFVESFRARGLNWTNQLMALIYQGRTIIRRCRWRMDGSIRLWGTRDGYELEFPQPEGGSQRDWGRTERLHPNCRALGPVLVGRRWTQDGWERAIPTYQWSN